MGAVGGVCIQSVQCGVGRGIMLIYCTDKQLTYLPGLLLVFSATEGLEKKLLREGCHFCCLIGQVHKIEFLNYRLKKGDQKRGLQLLF